MTPATAHRLLELHRAYLGSPPPDDQEEEFVDDDVDGAPVGDDERASAQDWPSSTGSASVVGDPTSTSDTPNVAGPSSPAIASEGPAQ